ncbi:MAG: AEC family transporter, partial [Geminicoccaceae bacterium]
MLTLLSDIVAVMAPVFLIAALGYGWARADLPYSGPFITTFMISVATPCLVFATLLRLRFEGGELAAIAGASLLCLALAAAVAFVILRL